MKTEKLFLSIALGVLLGKGLSVEARYDEHDDFHNAAKLNSLNELLQAEPKNADLYAQRANIYMQNDLAEKAVPDLTKQIELKPNPGAYMNRAQMYQELGKFNDAVNDYQHAAVLDPKRHNAYAELGALEMMLKHYDRAVAAYDNVLKLNPERFIERTRRAEAYLAMRKPEAALKDLVLVAPFDTRATCPFDMGEAYSSLGKYDKAVECYTLAIKRDDIYSKYYEARARAYDKLGKSELAKRDRATVQHRLDEYLDVAPFRSSKK